MPTKERFGLLLFEGTFTSVFKEKKSSQSSRNQGYSYFFCLIMEGSGSVQLNDGSVRSKNLWILLIRIQNTASRVFKLYTGFSVHTISCSFPQLKVSADDCTQDRGPSEGRGKGSHCKSASKELPPQFPAGIINNFYPGFLSSIAKIPQENCTTSKAGKIAGKKCYGSGYSRL
jgi:hypothetical protein